MTSLTTSRVLDGIDRLAARWAGERDDRLHRRHLDRADFDALAETGFLNLVVPRSHGGLWRSLAETGPVIVDAVQRLARGDHSVALVASMHPAVLIFWTASPEAEAPFTEAWSEQRAEVFRTATDGHFWGTITSEPGSGGDIFRTRATATPVEGSSSRFELRGEKHFGSGSEIVSYMITTAKPVGADMPMGFYLDLRDLPWYGSAGLKITREWDGVGMKATQSHATMLDGIEGTAWAWQGAVAQSSAVAGALGLSMFCGVVSAVVDAAMAEAERSLSGHPLRPYEDVIWTQAQIDHWMLTQAQRGLVDTLANAPAADAVEAAIKAKMGMAATAETVLDNACRAVGGRAFSASSPFASWYEDVRALGYLRPPWALAFDLLIAARETEPGADSS